MNLVTLIFPGAKAELSPLDDKLFSPSGWFGGRKTTSGETVSPASAMALSAYYACLHVVSEDIGKLPLKVYKEIPRGKTIAKDHPTYNLLRIRPNREMTSMSFRETINHWAMSWGNGYAEIVFNGAGVPVEMYPIHPSRVKMKRRSNGTLYYEVAAEITTSGQRIAGAILELHEMLHIHGLGDGLVGYSVLRFASETIGLGLAAQSFGAAFFGNGGNPSGLLIHPGALKEEARVNLRNSWNLMHASARNAHKVAIMEEGMKYEKIGIPPEEAQFIETREFQVEEICRWFRVPPHKIQHLLRATFNNIEQQNQEYVTDALQPWAERWEQEIEHKILGGDPNYCAEFLFAALLRGDANARSNFYRTMVNIGAMTPNEVRELENMNPGGEELDESYMQSNMMPLDQIGVATTRGAPPVETSTSNMEAEAQQRELQLDAQILAMRPMIVDAADRVLRKEISAVGKAAARYEGNASAFNRWASEFYVELRETLDLAMLPAVTSLSATMTAVLGCDQLSVDYPTFAIGFIERSRTAASSSLGKSLHPDNTAANLADQVIALVKEPSHAP